MHIHQPTLGFSPGILETGLGESNLSSCGVVLAKHMDWGKQESWCREREKNGVPLRAREVQVSSPWFQLTFFHIPTTCLLLSSMRHARTSIVSALFCLKLFKISIIWFSFVCKPRGFLLLGVEKGHPVEVGSYENNQDPFWNPVLPKTPRYVDLQFIKVAETSPRSQTLAHPGTGLRMSWKLFWMTVYVAFSLYNARYTPLALDTTEHQSAEGSSWRRAVVPVHNLVLKLLFCWLLPWV